MSKLLISLLLTLNLFGSAAFTIIKQRNDSLNKSETINYINHLNKRLPAKFDDVTVLYKIYIKKNEVNYLFIINKIKLFSILQYKSGIYVTHFNKEMKNRYIKDLKESLKSSICENKDNKKILEKMNIRYNYVFDDKDIIGTFLIKNKDCHLGLK